LSASDEVTISVVVATYNRRESLGRLLESLFKQTLSPAHFEVIVASDGSKDGTVEMVRQLAGRFHNLTVLDLNNRGPGAARNAGARLARGKYVAFTDDDCLANPDWLEQLTNVFERTGAVAVQGRTTTDRLTRTPLTHQMEVLSSWPTVLPTCNVAYRRDVFDKVGGFDEAFRRAHNEDADLAWRVEDIGAIVFAPEAHVVHPPRRDLFSKRAGWVRCFESDFLLYYKNPLKYRKHVSPSPWWTIYWKVFVLGQIELLKSCCRCSVKPIRPVSFCVGITLVTARWINLIRFFPAYCRARNVYRRQMVSAGETRAKVCRE
jgi:GT2 family glycosyltransferase